MEPENPSTASPTAKILACVCLLLKQLKRNTVQFNRITVHHLAAIATLILVFATAYLACVANGQLDEMKTDSAIADKAWPLSERSSPPLLNSHQLATPPTSSNCGVCTLHWKTTGALKRISFYGHTVVA
jgi:hypothetical protein